MWACDGAVNSGELPHLWYSSQFQEGGALADGTWKALLENAASREGNEVRLIHRDVEPCSLSGLVLEDAR